MAPPRRTANGSTTTLKFTGASPARSVTGKSARSQTRDAEYDSSRSFNGSRVILDPSIYGIQNTSVNIAAAFNQAQSGGSSLPPPPSGPPHSSMRSPLRSPGLLSPPPGPFREMSPAEKLQDVARAVSPVSFFLREPLNDDDSFMNGGNPSFSSLGNSSGDASYSYREEDAIVDRSKAAQASSSKPKALPRQRKYARAEDMPWRPQEDADDSDEGGGAGVVASGALAGRSATRGTRAEKGKGYLGTGELGIKRRNRKSVNYNEADSANEEEDGFQRQATPMVELTPVNGLGLRSPTPVGSNYIRGASRDPMDRRSREPTAGRVMATNITLAAAESNRAAVEFVGDLLNSLHSMGRKVQKKVRKNGGWKVVGAFVALALALRVVWLYSVTPSSPTYHAPIAPPSSMDELVARLTSIEHALSELSVVSDTREAAGNKAALGINDRVHGLESAVADGHRTFEARTGENSRDVRNMRDTISQLKGELSDVTSRIAKHDGEIKNVDRDIQQLKTRVGAVERDVRAALDDGRLRSALERILPTWMPVRTDSKNQDIVDPLFWAELKKVFVGQGEVESTVRRMISDGHKTPKQGVFSSDEAEHKLSELADRLFQKHANEFVAIRRNEFIELVEQQVGTLRDELQAVRDRTVAHPAAPHAPSSVTIKTAKGQDITSTLQALVDAALLKYSKDTIALPDYALFTAGGRVIPSATSDTLVLQQPSRFSKWMKGDKNVEGRQPATALHPDNAVGSCWPFNGPKGQLGVLLARRVVVKALTVEHAAMELALDMSTAPKEIEVWATVEGEENQAKAQQYLANGGDQKASSIPQTADRILLTTITYDASSSAPIQTFPVPAEITDYGIDTGIVIFRVESNWGGDFTCLYRVRVHGDVAVAREQTE